MKKDEKTSPDMFAKLIIEVLAGDDRVLFAFLYGSVVEEGQENDIDIAVYAVPETNFFELSADLKVALNKRIGLPPDVFDVRIINDLVEQGDLFGLLYLKNVLSSNRLLIDRNPEVRAEFLEQYGTRFRECEGLIQEVLS